MSSIHCSVVCNLKHWEKLKMPETWIQESLSGAFSWQRSWWVCSHHIFCGNCTSFSSPCQCTCTDLPTLGSNIWSSLLLGISGREIVRDQDACWTPICPGRINSTFQKKKSKSSPLASQLFLETFLDYSSLCEALHSLTCCRNYLLIQITNSIYYYMDFTIPCLISLSPVCASQQLALCSRRGHGKQDVIGPLWAKKMLLKIHRFVDVEHPKIHFSYFKRSVWTSEGSCLVTFKSLKEYDLLFLGQILINIQLWCLEVYAVTVGNKPHQTGAMCFWCEDPTLNLLWVKYAVSTPM